MTILISTKKIVIYPDDTQPSMLPGMPSSAICVQRFDDSLNSAIHTTYRSLLRSSSIHEPRDPPLKVVFYLKLIKKNSNRKIKWFKRGFESGHNRKVMPDSIGRKIPDFSFFFLPKTDYTIVHMGFGYLDLVMILPQVHLRKPCYDFYFL